MNRFCLCGPVVCLLTALVASAVADEPQRTVLFDGSSMDAWRGYASPDVPERWEIVDDSLHCSGGGGDLMTKEEYGDFDLQLEWKISDGGNSGIIYRARKGDPAAYFSGPEFQILDDAAAADNADKRHQAGALYGLYACAEDCVKPAGQWNTTRIVMHHNHLEHWLNGKKVVDCQIGSDDWNQRVAASKFAAWRQFGKSAKGHIVLQDHGNPVWYRNISVARLT